VTGAIPCPCDQKSGSRGARFTTGLALTDEGLRYWNSHKTGQQLKGGSAGFSTTAAEVNRYFATVGDGPDDGYAPF
jgi:hypothetical protein